MIPSFGRSARAAGSPGCMRVAVALLAGLAAPAACRTSTTEIVLTIDTDLAVTGELDQVKIDVLGPSAHPAPILVDLTAANAPSFPLSLGLTADGGLAPITVHVEGWRGGSASMSVDARTAFVDGQSRTLPFFLTLSCLGRACPTDQTCSLGACVPIDRPGTSLPAWDGNVPPRMDAGPTLIGGRSVWAMGWHSCATKGDTLSCWGRNDSGELGVGNTDRVPTRRAPQGLAKPISVGLGEMHSCACDHSGKAFCWGNNAEGQLGGGDLAPHLTPTQVVGLDDCVQVAGGGFHTCALRAGGVVSCWGRNVEGQLGQPASTTPSMMAVPVDGLNAVVEIRAGERFTCVRRTNGGIFCWGDNNNGQLGDGTTTSRDAPVRVMNLQSPSELAAGRFFACARLGSGKVSCWGQNSSGIMGTATSPVRVPVEIAGIDDALELATGHEHACVLHLAGTVSCWGSNQYGQLGDGTGLNSSAPVAIDLAGADATSIATGFVHSCARTSVGLFCWGQNVLQQLGDGSAADQQRPVAVVGF